MSLMSDADCFLSVCKLFCWRAISPSTDQSARFVSPDLYTKFVNLTVFIDAWIPLLYFREHRWPSNFQFRNIRSKLRCSCSACATDLAWMFCLSLIVADHHADMLCGLRRVTLPILACGPSTMLSSSMHAWYAVISVLSACDIAAPLANARISEPKQPSPGPNR